MIHELPDRLASLLERSALGDERAFDQFHRSTVARAYHRAYRLVKNTALAEEVVQEAYLDAWQLVDRFERDRGNALGWFLTLVHRRAVDRVRHVEASARRDDTYLRREVAATDGDTTSNHALAVLEARSVRAALATLPPAQRDAISLAYFEGLSHTQVAARTGVPLGTVKFRIRYGLRRLRSTLKPLVQAS